MVIRSGILSHSLPVAVAKVPLVISQDLVAIIPDDDTLDSDFLAFYFRRVARQILSKITRGTTVVTLDVTALRDVRIPTPPMKEQLAIAALLKDLLVIQSERDRSDHAMEGLLDGLGRKLFAHPSKEWPTVPLGDHAEIRRGIRTDASAKQSGLFRKCISPTNLKNGSLDLTSAPDIDIAEDDYRRSNLRRGDILLPVIFHTASFPSNMTMWRDAMPDCVYSDRLIRIRCSSPLLASYAYFALSAQGNYFRQLASSIGEHSRIDPSLLRNVQLRIPPRELLLEFDELFHEYISLLEGQAQCRAKLAALFNSMLHRSFLGFRTSVWPGG